MPDKPHVTTRHEISRLARRDAARAVSILNEAFRLDPDLPGLAEELANALEAAGHRVRAAEVRKRYVLRE
jgi:predicted Zn-dependent protease